MPLDVLGRTRATLIGSSSIKPWPIGLGNLLKTGRAGDRSLQLLIFNEEFLVNASHQLALITSLPFVHTARRYYRLNGLVSPLDCCVLGATLTRKWEGGQTWSFRGSKSRNKVSVGEPAEGSLTRILTLKAKKNPVNLQLVVVLHCARALPMVYVHVTVYRRQDVDLTISWRNG